MGWTSAGIMRDWWSCLVAAGTKETDSLSMILAFAADRCDGVHSLASTISNSVIFVASAIDA
jgi:hypothetical protein